LEKKRPQYRAVGFARQEWRLNLALGQFPQFESLDFARRCLGQLFHEIDPVRILKPL
jgi:hypothetical protein